MQKSQISIQNASRRSSAVKSEENVTSHRRAYFPEPPAQDFSTILYIRDQNVIILLHFSRSACLPCYK
jgi:hypothetical protein